MAGQTTGCVLFALGREATADLVVAERKASRVHCAIERIEFFCE